MAVTMIIQTGKRRGTKLALSKPEVVIGRDESCGLKLAARDVSRRHCRLLVQGSTCQVEDLGSQNGTLVNGDPIQGLVTLKPGDRLAIGPLELLVAPPVESTSADKAKSNEARTSPAQPTPKAAKTAATDDDVASWLMEPDGQSGSAGDSTVTMKAYTAPPQPTAEEIHDHPDSADADSETTQTRRFASLAEEAADIIRRHKEKIESGG